MNFLEFKGDPAAKKNVTVCLHGFPGIRSIQNRDIAERISKETGRHVYAPLYSGLGFSPGEFSFRSCREEVETLVVDLISKHGHIDLVGHSWGGYLSLTLAAKHGPLIDKMILLSPLLDFTNAVSAAEATSASISRISDEPAGLSLQINLGDKKERAQEFVDIGTDVNATSLAKKVDTATQVWILQAAGDDVTLEKYALELMRFFKVTPKYEVLQTDHSFVRNRPAATAKIIAALETNSGSSL